MARSGTKTAEIIELGGDTPTNGAAEIISFSEPYLAEVTVTGTAEYLWHAWNVEAVQAKADAAKGSKAKKTDDLESYVYRDERGYLAIPGHQLRGALIGAARYRQDPRSPRKSAMDLYKAGIVVLTQFASVGQKKWDFEHKCRVVVQRNAITRTRPAMKAGWTVSFQIQVLLPEYIPARDLNESIVKAGMFCALGDYRPTYGRFQVVKFSVS